MISLRILAGACLIAFAPLAAQAEAGPQKIAAPAFDLEKDVTRALSTFDVPGMAIAIVKDGKVVAARGFGVRKLGAPDKVDGKTLFEIASNSKAFTAALLAMLVDEGKLAWDDPVVKHLPDFQMYDPYVTREMTVRDLLVHRSGLGLGAGDLLWWPTTTFSSDEIIERLRYVKPATSFRSRYAYDNLLYIVAAKIVANKMGMSWGQAVHARILKPLGMNDTTTSLEERSTNFSDAHSKIGETTVPVKHMPVGNAAGAVGVNTGAEDIAKWMLALLDNGKGVVSAKQLREMWTEQTPIRIPEPKGPLASLSPNFSAYGLGFQLRDYHGRKVAFHGGALQGFYSRVLLIPEEKLGIAILTNAENSPSMTALQYRIMDQFMNVPATDWIQVFHDMEVEEHKKELARLKEKGSSRAAASKPSLPMTAYAGEYKDAWYGAVSIRPNGSKWEFVFSRTPDMVGELEHYQFDTFIVRWKERNLNADAYLTFSLTPEGTVERAKMKAVSSETDFSYDFHDLDLVPAAKK